MRYQGHQEKSPRYDYLLVVYALPSKEALHTHTHTRMNPQMRKSLGIVTLHVASPFGHVGSRTWSARSGHLYWVNARNKKQELAALQDILVFPRK